MINSRAIESCLREGETRRNAEYGMVTLKCDVVFHIKSRLVALGNACKNVDTGTDHGVHEKLCGISSMGSLTTTQLLSQINYMRQTERKRRGMGGSQHELREQQFLAVLSDTD